MKNSNNMCIPVRMGMVHVIGKDHDIRSGVRTDIILVSVNIICGVVNLKYFMMVYPIVNEE